MTDITQPSLSASDVLASNDSPPPRQLWQLWRQGEQPKISEFLARIGELKPVPLAAVLRVDQRERWQLGECILAEQYLREFPVLLADREAVLDLIYGEFLLREEQGETLPRDEYLNRFPEYASQLILQVDFHQAAEEKTFASATHMGEGETESAFLPSSSSKQVAGHAILEMVGQGGMGVVYKARHLRLNRLVALKMIRTGASAQAEEVARFRNEAEAVARLQHPNIVQIFEVGEHEGQPFVALEFVDGGSLAQKLAGTPQPAFDAARLVETLGHAMHFAHQHQIVHRDLKPSNILLTSEGTAKITDFGLAKQLDSGYDQTRTGAILGTPSYMAPEQASGKVKEITPATDIYSLGAVLYELLTGRPPFKAATLMETIQLVVSQEPVPLSRLQPSVPRDLETICLKCLQKEPSRRYGSALELADDLRRFQEGQPILARPVGQVERLWRWCRRRPAAAALVAALVLLVFAGLGGGFWYQQMQIWWAGEQARQETALAGRKTYLNQEVAAAVREAEQEHKHLSAQLENPLKVQVLLSELTQWQQSLDRVQAAQARARKLSDGEPHLIDPDLASRLETLTEEMNIGMQAYHVADKLDTVRQQTYAVWQQASTWVEGQQNSAPATTSTAAVFQEAGLAMEVRTDAAELAERVRKSPARYALVAALDFWTELSTDAKLQQHLMMVARLADPDPWRDQVRDPKSWRDSKALDLLASSVDVKAQSPQILAVLADRLPTKASQPLLRKAVLAHPQDFWLYFTLAVKSEKVAAEQIGYYQAALAIRPRSTAALSNLGNVLRDKKETAAAIICFRKAIELDPKFATAHNGLGLALRDNNDLKGGIASFEKALEYSPKFAFAYNNLASALRTKGDQAEAIACCNKGLETAPDFAPLHNTLGLILMDKKELNAAIACYDIALKINPKFVQSHYNKGRALFLKQDLDGAIPCYQKAIALEANNAEAHCNLGLALRQKGEFAAGLKELKTGHALGVQRPVWTYQSAQWIKQCEQLLAQDQKLTAIQKGQRQPQNAAEQLALAELCRIYKKQYAAATKFYADAFAAEPQLTADLKKPNRYNATCAAVLAAAGQGKDADQLDAPAQAKLRQQALDWLRTDLELWRQHANSKEPMARQTVIKKMSLWQSDPDLVSLRDAKALALLPEEERLAWQRLWGQVAELIQN